MIRLTKGLILVLLVSTGLFALEAKKTVAVPPATALKTDIATQDVQIFTADNSDGKITPKSIEEAFVKEGFFISEHRDMNAPFVKNFKETTFDIYNLFTVYRKDTVRNLAVNYPEIGLFTPMSMSIYAKKGSKTISVAFLSASASARMMSIPEDNEEIVALGKSVIAALHAAMPSGKLETVNYKMSKPSGDLIAKASLDIAADDDWEDVKDDFQMEFEGELAPNKFILAGYTDLGYDFEENNIETYNFYDTYSICKLEVIYVVAKKHPEAGAFAPCSVYMYQKKGENKMHMAFPTVHKWIAALGIEDKESIDVLITAQKAFEGILEKLTKK
ncbi:MAG: DUF302 domain-containing protein [Sulfurovum sp.]|nr:DUF302 domain-containing protein [Sulfurovum sp.]